MRALALDMLVGPLWREGAAREQGVTFTQAELDAHFARYVHEQFPKQSDLQAFLRRTGFSRSDLEAFNRDGMYTAARPDQPQPRGPQRAERDTSVNESPSAVAMNCRTATGCDQSD